MLLDDFAELSCGPRFTSAVMVLLAMVGCAPEGQNAPVKVDVAQSTLQSTLESWKSGKTLDDLQKDSPSVVVQDQDWSGGAKLIAFEVQPDAQSMDANLLAKVKLTLAGSDGKQQEKIVTYMVGTDPVLTVFRDMFH